MLLVFGGLVTAITTLSGVITSQIQKRTNPLNGTLVKLDKSLVDLSTALTKIEMRTADSDRALDGHTEKLIILTSTMAQLAANEAQQTTALLGLGPSIDKSLTGCAERIMGNCKIRSGEILTALKKQP